jgi:hypothetical protein
VCQFPDLGLSVEMIAGKIRTALFRPNRFVQAERVVSLNFGALTETDRSGFASKNLFEQ